MNARLLNWQHVYKVGPYRVLLNDVVSRAVLTSEDVAAVEAAGDKCQINVIFAGPLQIRRLNAEQRGIDATTDVLSFPMLLFKNGRLKTRLKDFDFETRPSGVRVLHLGDIVICPKRAEEQAVTIGQSLSRELAYLALHGALHLIGYDHIDVADARLMRAMEKRMIEPSDQNE
ncbi:MAG TPA: rRNA maturation RNase YbeY [Clostridiaceae bacterium]|nr:rRNA maturation RNase YbeY [Clostridiaceae bacterium]